jgi:glycerol uptake facilitator-like aquaporin/protein-tyrosine-phosphatase
MAERPFNVLFLCTGNSARSIMAEAILSKLGQGKFHAYSAGSHPKGQVNPHAIRLLQSLGYDTSPFRSKSWNDFAKPGAPPLDFAFTVCDNAAGETCPVWPGQPMTAHWGVPDPAEATGSPAEIALAFKDAYRMLYTSAHWGLHGAADPEPRPTQPAIEAERDRPHERRNGEGKRTELMPSLPQRVFCEWLGTAFLLAAVVGSGIMAQKLAGGNGALALLCNTIPTGAILVVLILAFGPLSGAHFNPAVSLALALRGEVPSSTAALYIGAQVFGGITGVWAAHLMFELPLWQFSTAVRTGSGQWLAEAVATFGLLLTIFGCIARTPAGVPYAVGLYITSAYWFTASTSFANPAVTIARALSDTFAGIAPAGVPAFIAAQLVGMLMAVALGAWLWPKGCKASRV